MGPPRRRTVVAVRPPGEDEVSYVASLEFLFETLFITLVGGGLGFLISWGICSVFPQLGFKEYVGDPVISFQVAAITTAILGGIGLLAGYFPARTAANLRPVEALKM